ncbi:MAG: carboxypeptidase-like regulatory domain-containing protein, partial [Flavobacterium micromati]|nr:carboxypeptidase-like regulatory domain-containing protein [Flavobacterium micromati]
MRLKFKWIFTLLVALSMQFSFAQERTVSGVVSDATGPIPGANVLIKGTKKGVSTNFDGTYSITVNPGATLEFRSLGFLSQTKVVGTSSSINVTLATDA